MKTTRQQQNLKQQRVIFAWSYKYIQYCKSYFKNQNYIIGQLRYFGNNLSRTSKQAEIYIFYELYVDKVIRGVISALIKLNVYR